MVRIVKEANETVKDYTLRLFRNKSQYQLSNAEIAELVNQASNSNKDESTYRKWFTAYEEGYQDATAYSEENSAILQEIADKRIRAEMQIKKAQTERIETNRWIREQARTEMFYERLNQSIQENISYNPSFNTISYLDNKEKSAVLFLADQHYGVDFTIYGLNNEVINEYSPEIFEQRMEKILHETITQCEKNNISNIDIICLGDSLDGHLRNSQLIKLRWGVIDCAVKYANYMFKWLNELSKNVHIKFYNTSGNHTEMRLLDGKKGEHERENLDKVIMAIIRNGVELVGNTNIDIIENKTGYVYDTLSCGYTIFGFHGEIKNLETAHSDFMNLYGKPIDYIAAGHLHHNDFQSFGFRKGSIRVGSIIGVDDFAMKIRKCSDATANFAIFEKDKGLVDMHTIVLN